MNYSVLISLYYKEKPANLDEALKSIFAQSVASDDVVLVEDGPIGSDLEAVVQKYLKAYPQLNVVRFPENRGLGYALNDGIKVCKNELIARMDTDDISKPFRMEKQLAVMAEHPEYDIVGAWIEEFVDDIHHILSWRKTPELPADVHKYARKRSPVNHVTAMFRKSSVIAAGGYQTKYFPEDYFLWVKMLQRGCKIYNIPESLVWVRCNRDTYLRRGGWKYACDEAVVQWNMYRIGFLPFPRFLANLLIRFPVRIMPNFVRLLIYKILR